MASETSFLPQVGIIIPLMDRTNDIKVSLPSLLNQEYPNYTVHILDHCSQDGLDNVLQSRTHPRLKLIRCPRPDYFNFSRARNIGTRYSSSDLLFFLNGDNQFQDEGHLSRIVGDFLNVARIDYRWYRNWRHSQGYTPLRIRHGPVISTSYRHVYCHCLGSPLLIDRHVFQQLGGFNEALENWGYEDSDLIARLELAGFGRIAISGITQPEHSDDIRVKNFQEKDKYKSWQRNRQLSDELISAFGPIITPQRYPGRCEWVEIDGVRYDGAIAPQQSWEMASRITRASLGGLLLAAVTRLMSYVQSLGSVKA